MIDKESISLVAISPFVREFTHSIILSIQDKKGIRPEPREVIHADIVPKVPQKIIQSSFMKPITIRPIIPKKIIETKKQFFIPVPSNIIEVPEIPKEKLQNLQEISGYGKIDSLINDPSISVIECSGPGKPIVIMRIGQRQFTKIILNKDEIINILEEVSHRARIPLMEGVFRAAVDNFLINAIVAEMVGSRFVITKNINYIVR